MDFTTITTALAGIKTASEIAKAIKDPELSVEQAEVKLKIAELISALSDAKMSIAEIRELLQEKEEEIKELNTQLQTQQNLEYEPPYYWLKLGEKRDGPFCQLCYDENRKLIRLQDRENGYWRCHSCDKTVKDSSHVPRPARSSRRPNRRNWLDGL